MNMFSLVYKVFWYHLLRFFTCSNLAAVGVTNAAVVPPPVIAVAAAMGSSTSQQHPPGGSGDTTTTMGHGLFPNQTEDSDDDYDI